MHRHIINLSVRILVLVLAFSVFVQSAHGNNLKNLVLPANQGDDSDEFFDSFFNRFMKDPFFSDSFFSDRLWHKPPTHRFFDESFDVNPFEEVNRVRERMKRLLGDKNFFGSGLPGRSGLFSRGVDIRKEGDEIVVVVKVPDSLSHDDLEITVKNGNILVIRSKIEEVHEEQQGAVTSGMQKSHLFQRVQPLGVVIDENTLDIKAEDDKIIIRATKMEASATGSGPVQDI